jgi:hypothetical protein
MNKLEHTSRIGVVLPWAISLLLLVALLLIGLISRDSTVDPFGNIVKKSRTLSDMRINLLRAVEAEKSAVLAETDEDSRIFAEQALLAADQVETDRRQLEPIFQQEHLTEEISLFGQFETCWNEFRRLDRVILDLAVQNTNLKAAALSRTKGAEAVERFDRNLSGLIEAYSRPGACSAIPDMAYQTLVAALKIYSLHPTHIQAATDEEMDLIEETMKTYDRIARANLTALTPLVGDDGRETLTGAAAAYDDLMKTTDELLKLSRANTNIKSMELSLGKKRIVAAQCEDTLTALNAAIQNRTFKATR